MLTRAIESSQSHSHSHNHNENNVAKKIRGEERFSQFCLLLESHFKGPITPVSKPRLFAKSSEPPESAIEKVEVNDRSIENDQGVEMDEEEDIAELEAEEMDRLHGIGLPVPGLELQVDKHVATIWLETLEVDCLNGVVRDRVKAGIEQTIESMASFWSHGSI